MSREWTAKWVGTEAEDSFRPVIFKDFYLDDKVLKATLYITGAGLFEVYVNGQRVGEDRYTPYRISLASGIQYFTYDVTELLHFGPDSDANSVDIFLGKGWENDAFGDRYAVKAEFEIEVEKISVPGMITEDADLAEYSDLFAVDAEELIENEENPLQDEDKQEIYFLAMKGSNLSQKSRSPFELRNLNDLDGFLKNAVSEEKTEKAPEQEELPDVDFIVEDLKTDDLFTDKEPDDGPAEDDTELDIFDFEDWDEKETEKPQISDLHVQPYGITDAELDAIFEDSDVFNEPEPMIVAPAVLPETREDSEISEVHEVSEVPEAPEANAAEPENADFSVEEIYMPDLEQFLAEEIPNEEPEALPEELETVFEELTAEEAAPETEEAAAPEAVPEIEPISVEEAAPEIEEILAEEAEPETEETPEAEPEEKAEEIPEEETNPELEVIPEEVLAAAAVIPAVGAETEAEEVPDEETDPELEDIPEEVLAAAAVIPAVGAETEAEEVTNEETDPELEDIPEEVLAAAAVIPAVEAEAEAEIAEETLIPAEAEAEPVEEVPAEPVYETIIIGTDETWGYYASDIAMNELTKGEVFNRLLWDENENPEKNVVVLDLDVPVVPHASYSVKIQEILPVENMISSETGSVILDFGHVFTGFVSFHSSLPKGAEVTLTYAEELGEDGSIAEGSPSFTYVSDGVPEIVMPHFAYFTGRYVQAVGFEEIPDASSFAGCVIYADMEQTGFIETSDPAVNEIFERVLDKQKVSSIVVPEDCTERDVSLFAPAASFNMNTSDFLRDYLKDLRNKGEKGKSDTASIIWNLYMMFGDETILSENYDLMKDWTDRIYAKDAERGELHYLYDFAPDENEFAEIDPDTDVCFVTSARYLASVRLISRAAQELGNEQDAYHYERLARKIKQAILEEYFTLTGRFSLDTQTAYAAALREGLYTEKDKICEAFLRRLEKDEWKSTCCRVEASYICQVLADNGMTKQAYDLLLSGNPYEDASDAQFLYGYIAGIRPLEAGFGKVEIAPIPDGRLTSFRCRYLSVKGSIVSDWNVAPDGTLSFHFEIPDGVTAKIVLPNYPVCASSGNEMTVAGGIYDYSYMPQPSL